MTERRPPMFFVREREFAVLSAAIRQRQLDRRLAYTFDPGLRLAEQLAVDDDPGLTVP